MDGTWVVRLDRMKGIVKWRKRKYIDIDTYILYRGCLYGVCSRGMESSVCLSSRIVYVLLLSTRVLY